MLTGNWSQKNVTDILVFSYCNSLTQTQNQWKGSAYPAPHLNNEKGLLGWCNNNHKHRCYSLYSPFKLVCVDGRELLQQKRNHSILASTASFLFTQSHWSFKEIVQKFLMFFFFISMMSLHLQALNTSNITLQPYRIHPLPSGCYCTTLIDAVSNGWG